MIELRLPHSCSHVNDIVICFAICQEGGSGAERLIFHFTFNDAMSEGGEERMRGMSRLLADTPS